MPALTSKRASAALGGLRREFDRRRKLAAVATGRVEKKYSSAPSPIPGAPAGSAPASTPRKPAAAAMIKRASVPTPTPGARAITYMEPAAAAIRRPSVPTPRKPAEAAAKKSYAPPPPPAPISPATAQPLLPSSLASKTIKKGSTVLVRTRVGALPTGMGLVLWLSARVVCDAEDGYFEVMYNGDFPPDDPFRTVRVARDQVKSMPPQQ